MNTRKFFILLRSRRARRDRAARSVMKDTSFFLANLSAELRLVMFQRSVGGPGPSMNIFLGELHTCIVPFLRCSHIHGQPTGRRTDVLVYTVLLQIDSNNDAVRGDGAEVRAHGVGGPKIKNDAERHRDRQGRQRLAVDGQENECHAQALHTDAQEGRSEGRRQ